MSYSDRYFDGALDAAAEKKAAPRRTRRWWHRPKAIALGIVVGLLAASSVALAAWLTTGSGTGASKMTTMVAPTAAAPTAGQLTVDGFPNTDSQIQLIVSNPNPGAVRLAGLTGTGATITTDVGGCTGANFSVNSLSGAGLVTAPAVVPIGGPTQLYLVGALHTNGTAPTLCQGATVTVVLAANALSWSTT